jgi:hypothetical protein
VPTGDCRGNGGKSPASAKGSKERSSAYFYSEQLKTRGPLHFHKWRVVKTFNGDTCVGTIVSYRDDFCGKPMPYTRDTPFTRLWKCNFFGDPADVFEEYDAGELSVLLSAAHVAGANGPAPASAAELLPVPANAFTAV